MQVFKKNECLNRRVGIFLEKLKIWILKHKQLSFEQRYAIEDILKENTQKNHVEPKITILE
jgi:hypothetical protein